MSSERQIKYLFHSGLDLAKMLYISFLLTPFVIFSSKG
uniref:Uncharacterized protein n=1 Tax=Siphoviridae sp. ctLqe90 TaxID=2825456 RepID=A0A8S5Q338_9CAUD|nr:MAG TPA: hypothetical protein [Siphoviridae sp. ctLqe90]